LINASLADSEAFEREFREKLKDAIATHVAPPPPAE